MKKLLFSLFLIPGFLSAQKKPLDFDVYDEWQSIGERSVSGDGKWVVYAVNPQEGDGTLYIESADARFKQAIPRGYKATITEDSRFVIFNIKPFFKETREAKIKKKKPDDMPKDSMGILELGKDSILKFSKIKSFKTPDKGFGWLAYQKEQQVEKPKAPANKTVDSLKKTIDSLHNIINELQAVKPEKKNRKSRKDDLEMFADSTSREGSKKGNDLVLYNLVSGKELIFKNTGDYAFDKNGDQLVFFMNDITKDTVANHGVVLYSLKEEKQDTILRGINEIKGFAFSDDGKHLSFMAESGKNKKALQKFYDLYLFNAGDNTARKIVDKSTAGMPENSSVSENGFLRFSENGKRLFFGTAPIAAPKDTTLIEMDLVKVDIWNYKDDYLQTQQLSRLNSDLKRNYQAVYDLSSAKMLQLASEGLPTISVADEGNADFFMAVTDTGRRVASQWTGSTLKDVYMSNIKTGEQKLVKKNLNGYSYISPTGKYILWYDNLDSNYHVFDGSQKRNITSAIRVPLYNELNDVPDDPRAYGIAGWHQDDRFLYIYDRYDMWKVDPTGKDKPVNLTGNGRRTKQVYRYVKTDPEEKYLKSGQEMYFDIFNEVDKSAQIARTNLSDALQFTKISGGNFSYSRPVKAKDADVVIYTKESYIQSPDLYLYNDKEIRLSAINPQQSEYIWGTAELFNWKTFSGKVSTGIVYKPENFDPNKKYPVILYFYERLSDNLNKYVAPAPTPSRLNITDFVSRGYIVFTPDIAYTRGKPGESAYDYIVSGALALAKNKWVDAKNMGIQGQSWGGYQVSYLITRTNMFKAAWAGAPVGNMFSAYGGIRWESGMNRQFQYEKTQSRIGATIWEKPELYIENSPLFHLKKVNTPLVIMHNDADGAVPWYQGIELFTALRRLGKPVWMLNYNGEAHNLVQRKNRKDISMREVQFFDWLLKGEKPPRWITEGVKAVDKGKDWGLEID